MSVIILPSIVPLPLAPCPHLSGFGLPLQTPAAEFKLLPEKKNKLVSLVAGKRDCRNELQSKLKKRFFETSLPRSTQNSLDLADISLRGLSEASTSSAQDV